MTTETDMFAEESARKSRLGESNDAYPYSLSWARILASALESALDDGDACHIVMVGDQPAADAFFAMKNELRRIAAAEPSARCYLARVLRKLHEVPDCFRAVEPEWLDELRELARENVGDDGVTTEFAIALADEVDDLVRHDQVLAAAALLPELSFERTGYAETSDSIAAQVRALAAVYRVLRLPELLADMRSLSGSGSAASRVCLALVLAEDKDPQCASVLSALVEELEWSGSCTLCGGQIAE